MHKSTLLTFAVILVTCFSSPVSLVAQSTQVNKKQVFSDSPAKNSTSSVKDDLNKSLNSKKVAENKIKKAAKKAASKNEKATKKAAAKKMKAAAKKNATTSAV